MQTEPELSDGNFNRRYYETVRRAGTLAAMGRTAVRAAQYEELGNYEQRQYDEMFSGAVEALKGTLSSHYRFELKAGRLVACDGEPIEHILNRGMVHTSILAAEDPFYEPFLPKRARHEREELMEQERMARGETDYNTLVTLSPYSEEFATSDQNLKKLKAAAQKPAWKRAMLRISHWDGERMHIFTRSIDNSSVELLKKTAEHSLGYKFKANNSTDMLGERIPLDISDESWEALPDTVVGAADDILAARQGGVWHQGRTELDAKKLETFVRANADIIRQLVNTGRRLAMESTGFEQYKRAFDQKAYDYVALLETRLAMNNYAPMEDIEAAAEASGSWARAEGKVYDMCGLVLTGGEEASTGQMTGFESLLRLEGKKVTCPECKSKVVVPKKELLDGKLHCQDCGYGIDICTGKKFHKKPGTKLPKVKEPDFADRLAAALKKYSALDRAGLSEPS